MTADLVAFLRARLDEDERAATLATYAGGGTWRYDGSDGSGPAVIVGDPAKTERWEREANSEMWTCDDPQDGCMEYAANWASEGKHIARHDPARVLREVDAKRRILDEIVNLIDGLGASLWNEFGTSREEPPDDSQDLKKLLALPYADHPDYRDDWRP